MPNFISEDQIEKAIISVFQNNLNYRCLNCYTADPEDMNDRSGRTSKIDVLLKDILLERLQLLNKKVPESAILDAWNELAKSRAAMSLLNANKEIYDLIRDGVPITYQNLKGKNIKTRIKVIDFNEPDLNDYLVVSQLWIKGQYGFRRPDLLLYVNGIPLIFIELKNSNIALRNAYDDNLTNYCHDIPLLFNNNAVCILSNGLETRVGSFSADWEHFGEWLRVDDERKKVDRERIKEFKVSLDYAVLGLCEKTKLLDYIENFILYHKDTQKIIAKNHQFIGVNKAITSFENKEMRHGKLGVFWHTQGSGKSFSMVMFAQKIFRKYTGNYTFVIVTDREDLDGQIYRNFLNMGAVSKGEQVRPKNSEELREFLGTNRRYVFTLIQKFRYPKGKKYPLLSNRDDIIVIVDEAHRSQYKDLAENMRSGLPNAQYIAFTGTPLLGKVPLTKEWFGDYVSEYNFAQSIEDGATVPLYYDKRVPEVLIQNEELNEELAEILEDENLNDEQQEKLKREFATEMEVIKRDDRLETIAKDIIYHFPRRGYKGKGMVISVDKFTVVKMYDKIAHYRREELRKLRNEIRCANDEKMKSELEKAHQFLRDMDMAVVVSEEAGEDKKFAKQGLDIRTHRNRINTVDENGHDLEYKFKDPNDSLLLVFVCSMWLTGFDAPTVSTLYLDKPMKNHTLMQTIARANRVAPGKANGLIVDYYNVFRNLKRALADFAEGESWKGEETDDHDPVEEKSHLFVLLDQSLNEALAFCKRIGIDLQVILEANELFQNLSYFEQFADILLQKDEWKKQYIVYDNTISALYEACKPDIFETEYNRPMVAVIQYLRGVLDGKIVPNLDRARQRVCDLLDESVVTTDESKKAFDGHVKYTFRKSHIINLSNLNFNKLREAFNQADYKNIEITDLRLFIEHKLQQMMEKNVTRIDFMTRFQEIINRYNSGGMTNEDYFDELIKFAEDLREEDKRHIRQGLTEEELELFDFLEKEKMTKAEEQAVKLAAKRLIKRLTEEHPRILTLSWYKDTQTSQKVRSTIMDILDETLPESYDRKTYNEKVDVVFNHIYSMAASGKGWAAAA